jgi:hypothetical protein
MLHEVVRIMVSWKLACIAAMRLNSFVGVWYAANGAVPLHMPII